MLTYSQWAAVASNTNYGRFERDERGGPHKGGWLLWRTGDGWWTDGWGEWFTASEAEAEAEALAEADRVLGRAPAPAPAPTSAGDEALAFFAARPPGECPCGRMRRGCPWHDPALAGARP